MGGHKKHRRREAGANSVGVVAVVRAPSQKPFKWTRELRALLGKIPDPALAAKAGVARQTVYLERHRRGISPYRDVRPPIEWTEEMLAELGRDTDRNVAAALGIPSQSVCRKRHVLGIPPFTPQRQQGIGARHWTQWELSLLGAHSDYKVAEMIGVSHGVVHLERLRLGIAAFGRRPPKIEWTKKIVSALGRVNDSEISVRFGIHPSTVKIKRDQLGIPPFVDKRGVVATPELLDLIRRPSAEVTRLTGLKAGTIRKLRLEHGVEGRDGRFRWTAESIARLGRDRDEEIAADLGVGLSAVGVKRRSLHIPPPVRPVRPWTAAETALLGTAPDGELAARLGRTTAAVAARRISRGLPRFGGRGRGGRPKRRKS